MWMYTGKEFKFNDCLLLISWLNPNFLAFLKNFLHWNKQPENQANNPDASHRTCATQDYQQHLCLTFKSLTAFATKVTLESYVYARNQS